MCKNACLQCEKLSGLYLQDIQVRKAERRDPKHANFTVRTSTQSGHSHISNYLLDYCIAISKHLRTNSSISLQKSGPLPAPSVTVSGVLQRINLALLLPKYHQLTQAHQVYLHHPLLYLQPHFLINCYHQSPDQFSKSWHYWHFEPDDCCRSCPVYCRLFSSTPASIY